MSLVDAETGEVVVLMDKAAALKITADIKAWAGTLWLKIEEAHRGQAWRALGYESWGAYLEAEFDISRSRGYQLVTHARAVRALAEAAGYDPESTMWTPREGHTREINVEAAASDIAAAAADLPDDATDEDRVEVVKVTIEKHRKTAAQVPPPEPAEPAPDGADEDDGPSGAPTSDEDRPGVDMPPADPAPKSLDELYPDETYRINAGKAAVRIYENLRVIDPERLAELSDMEGRASWTGLAKTLRSKADEIDAAFAAPTLRRVQ